MGTLGRTAKVYYLTTQKFYWGVIFNELYRKLLFIPKGESIYFRKKFCHKFLIFPDTSPLFFISTSLEAAKLLSGHRTKKTLIDEILPSKSKTLSTLRLMTMLT